MPKISKTTFSQRTMGFGGSKTKNLLKYSGIVYFRKWNLQN
jgi:hypothetical protein